MKSAFYTLGFLFSPEVYTEILKSTCFDLKVTASFQV